MIQPKPQLGLRPIFLISLCLFLCMVPKTRATAQKSGAQPGDIVYDTCYYKGDEAKYRIPAPSAIQSALQSMRRMSEDEIASLEALKTAEIVFEFGDGFGLLGPDEQAAKDAFEFAAGIWEMEVVSSVPIVIAADFLPLSGGTIGFNGSPTVIGVPGAADPTTAYTSALANSIAGVDLLPGIPDGEQGYNTNFTFYFGTDGNTPPGVLDFATVVLHEIGHSMGIFGRSNGGAGVGENGGANPTPWDRLAVLGDGTPILDLGFGSPAQQAALVSNDLFMDGSRAKAALGGTRPKIYAPSTFQPGSSFSHWDEVTFPAGDPNSLMTPFAESGASNFNIGDITRGILADEGWTLSSDLVAQDAGVIALLTPVSGSDLSANETVTVLIRNFGTEAVTNFDVSYSLDGAPAVTEAVGAIDPQSELIFSFATTVDLSVDGQTYAFDAFTTLVGDENPGNDEISTTVSNLIPSVDVPITSLDFGTLGVGLSTTDVIPIVNDGAGPLAGEVVLSNLIFGGSAAFSSTEDFSIPVVILPGETFNLPIDFSPPALGVETGTVTFSTNAGPPITIDLSGEGVEPAIINVDPTSVSVNAEIGEAVSQTVTISNLGVADLEVSLSSQSNVGELSRVAAPFQQKGFAARAQKKSPFRTAPKKGGVLQLKTKQARSELVVDTDDYIYQLDDGSSENGLGIGSPWDLMWMNAFTTAAGAAVITEIATTVNEGPAQMPVRFLLYEDPDDDGDPSNAILLQDVSGVVDAPGTDLYSGATIPPTTVEGVFFVAALVSSSGFAIPLDQTTSQQASWVVASDGFGTFDVNNLTNNTLPPDLLDNIGFPGNVMVRANGQFFAFSPISGTVPAGSTLDVQLDFAANAPGIYTADLVVNSNDPGNSQVVVPITMDVAGVSITANPTSFDIALPQGATTTEVLTLTNESNAADVTFSVELIDDPAAQAADAVRQLREPPVTRLMPYQGPDPQLDAFRISDSYGANLGVPQYSTDFESLSLGDINGQDGWFGEFGIWRVDNINPANGAQHFSTVSDGFGFTFSESPLVPVGNDPISSFSALVSAQPGVTWQLAPADFTAGFYITRIQINPDGTLAALVPDGLGGAVFEPMGASAPAGYFKLALEVERSTSNYTVLINDTPIYSNTGFAGNIEVVQLISLMEVPGPALDVDDFQILDGSSEAGSPFVTANPATGVIPAGGSVDLDLLFDADRDFGRFESNLVITLNNSPLIPPLVVPVALTVEGPPSIEVSPTVLIEDVNFDQIETAPLTITNTGGEPLTFDLTVFGAEAQNLANQNQGAAFIQQKRQAAAKMNSSKYREDVAESGQQFRAQERLEVKVGSPFFTEDFDGAFPPAGWSVIDNEGNGVQWESNSFFGEGNYAGTGGAAMANSDAFPFTDYDTELRTPSISIAGLEALSLEYVVNYQNLSNLDFLDVDISADGGATWTNMLSWNEDHGAFFDLPGEEVSIDLEPYVTGATDIIIRWRYYNPNLDDWDWYVQVDDVQLIANTEVWFAVEPASGVVPVGESLVLDAIFDASVVEIGQYVAGVAVNSNAVNTPVVGVVAVMNELEPAIISVAPTEIYKEFSTEFVDFEVVTIENQGESDLVLQIDGEFENTGGLLTVVAGDQLALQSVGSPLGDDTPQYIAAAEEIAVSSAVYATNFETLALGSIHTQDGWQATPFWDVSDADPYEGDQHLRSVADGSGAQTLAFTPGIGQGAEPFSSFSLLLKHEPGASWVIQPQSISANAPVTALQWLPTGELLIFDAAIGDFVNLGTPPAGDYFEFGLEVERATGAYTFKFEGFPIYSGQAIAGDVEEVVFVGFNDGTGSVFNVDNFQLIDGTIPTDAVRVSPRNATIPSGGSLDVFVDLNAGDLPLGIYTETLTVKSTDPLNPAVPINVTLNVLEPASITVDPESITAVVPQFSQESRPLNIANGGEADLEYSIQIVGPAEPVAPELVQPYNWRENDQIVEKLKGQQPSPAPTAVASSVISGGLVTIFNEDFDGGTFPPADWQVVDNEGSGMVWALSSDWRDINVTGGAGEAATADSDLFGPAPFDTELISPTISTGGNTGLVLEYLANYQVFAGDFLDLDISTDGGITWTNMLSWDESQGGFFQLPGVLVSIPIDPYLAGASDFVVRWRYYNPNPGNDWDWYAQIDDVKIGSSWLSVDPVGGIVEGGDNTDLDVLFNTNLLDLGTYEANILISSNDPETPVFTVPVELEVEDRLRILNFTLVNSRTDEDVRDLVDGDKINLLGEDLEKINIRANTNPEVVGSVKFKLEGKKKHNRIENVFPYALFGDGGGNYRDWKPKLGSYTLTATPYSESGARGEEGDPLTIDFTVVEENNTTLTFALIDAENDVQVGPLEDGAVLDLEALGLESINIEAIPDPEEVYRVEFELTGAEEKDRDEKKEPYALFGDKKGDFKEWEPTPGEYVLTARAITEVYEDKGKGKGKGKKKKKKGKKKKYPSADFTIAFTVVGEGTNHLEESTPEQQLTRIATPATIVMPNPVDHQFTIRLPEAVSGPVVIQIMRGTGMVLDQQTISVKGSRDVEVQLTRALRPDVYYLKVLSPLGTEMLKIIKN